MNTVSFITVDVFTTDRFAGNQLAVIPDARVLSDAQMQAIATEFGYSEVTFVLPPENPENTARVRIFTPTTEVPFAGHPNVGTAFVLAGNGSLRPQAGRRIGVSKEKAGLVEVTLLGSDGTRHGRKDRRPAGAAIGPAIDAATIARLRIAAPGRPSSTELIRRCAFRSACPSRSPRCATSMPFRQARPNVSARGGEQPLSACGRQLQPVSLCPYARAARPYKGTHVRCRSTTSSRSGNRQLRRRSALTCLAASRGRREGRTRHRHRGVKWGRRSLITVGVDRGTAQSATSASRRLRFAMRGEILI
ncbi:PhzF family phenazine biosynthesis isomerase [Sinorhizobium meliloti]|nr:PhzF family phenazine biosynthesis isomerase [Sinorhizobium meliloti]